MVEFPRNILMLQSTIGSFYMDYMFLMNTRYFSYHNKTSILFILNPLLWTSSYYGVINNIKYFYLFGGVKQDPTPG